MDTFIRALITLLTLATGLPASVGLATTVPDAPSVPTASLSPVVDVEGGAEADRAVVTDAVAAYVANGLALPDLTVQLHDDGNGCKGHQGLFGVRDGVATIDLCYTTEFIVLHEIGHAWARVNLDATDRRAFSELAGSPAWSGHEHAWHERGTEVAANAMAHGLLSEPLNSRYHRSRELGQFTALTGLESPRLADFDETDEPAAGLTDAELENLGAYAAWRANG